MPADNVQPSPQRDAFLGGEGDAWFSRNAAALRQPAHAASDPVIESVPHWRKVPKSVLEIGAADGWRLDALRRATGAECHGIEPSRLAVESGRARFPEIALTVGSAESLPFENGRFEAVIFGFCLYLCDRSDLFRIAAEADRVLAGGGVLIVFDFYTEHPQRKPYRHRPGLFSYKLDYARMFLWNPAYRRVFHRTLPFPGVPEDDLAVTVLSKDAWPAGVDAT